MEQGHDAVQDLQRALSEGEDLLVRWMDVVARRSWRLKTVARSNPDQMELLRAHCSHFLDTLSGALRDARELEMGSAVFREAVQNLSFTAGWMAGVGLPVTDAVALVHGLEEAVGMQRSGFFQSLMVVVTEAFASSLVQRERAHFRDTMEKSQVVCDPHPRLPCLFLVGEPDRQALEDAVGRVMMLAAMRDARVVLVDGCALLNPAEVLPMACSILAEHSAAASVSVVLGGVSPLLQRELRACCFPAERCAAELSCFETHCAAMGQAMLRAGIAYSDLTSP